MERSVLLIDDDIDELDFFLLAAKEMAGSFICTYLDNALTAIRTITNLKPDIIFLDMNMPAMNGLECLTAIKNTEACRNIPVVLYSTYIDKALENKANLLNVLSCEKKPVTLGDFKEMLTRLLDKL